MQKKVLLVFLVIVVMVVGGVYTGLQMKYSKLETSLKEHLTKVEGYSEDEIISIKAKLSKMPKYPVYVEFADDPGTTYIFFDGYINEWTQLDPEAPQRIKEKEKQVVE